MPFVNIKLAGKLTKEQKSEIAKEISRTLVKVANKKQENIMIAFEELDRDCFARGEVLLEDLDKSLDIK